MVLLNLTSAKHPFRVLHIVFLYYPTIVVFIFLLAKS
jgi:hypothetical protein